MFKFTRARAPAEIAEVIEALVGPRRGRALLGGVPRRLCHAGRHPFHQGGRLQHRARAAALAAVRRAGRDRDGSADRFEGPGWALLDRLVDWCREAGLRVIVDLHAAPGGQTGVNHDDGTGFPLTFYVPRYRRAHHRAVARARRALSRRAGRARLRPAERADLALQRRGLSQSAARAALSRHRRRHPQRRSHHVVLLAGGQWSTSFAMFGRPFDANAVYTYHKFWAKPTRDALQSYLEFQQSLECADADRRDRRDEQQLEREISRMLHEQFGIGWCFWPYKNSRYRIPPWSRSQSRPAGT